MYFLRGSAVKRLGRLGELAGFDFAGVGTVHLVDAECRIALPSHPAYCKFPGAVCRRKDFDFWAKLSWALPRWAPKKGIGPEGMQMYGQVYLCLIMTIIVECNGQSIQGCASCRLLWNEWLYWRSCRLENSSAAQLLWTWRAIAASRAAQQDAAAVGIG